VFFLNRVAFVGWVQLHQPWR